MIKPVDLTVLALLSMGCFFLFEAGIATLVAHVVGSYLHTLFAPLQELFR